MDDATLHPAHEYDDDEALFCLALRQSLVDRDQLCSHLQSTIHIDTRLLALASAHAASPPTHLTSMQLRHDPSC